MSVQKFAKQLMDRGVPVHSYIVYRDDKIIAADTVKELKLTENHRLFSVAKSLTGLCIGLLLDEGKLRLEDTIVSYYPEYTINKDNNGELADFLSRCTIKDMLMMRTCYSYCTYKQKNISSWVGSFFESEPDHKPGAFFNYDTAGAHVLADLVHKISGKNIMDYFRYRLPGVFSEKAYVLEDPQGVSQGGSGLMASSFDFLRLGILLLDAQILSDKEFCEKYETGLLFFEFVRTACSNLTSTAFEGKSRFESFGYGYYIWQTEHEGFMCYGMGGQLAAVYPKQKTVLITTSDTQGMSNGIDEIFDAFYEHLLFENESAETGFMGASNKQAAADYRAVTDEEFEKLCKPENCIYLKIPTAIWGEKYSPNEDELKNIFSGRKYMLSNNKENLFESITLSMTEGVGHVDFVLKNKEIYSFDFGFSDSVKGMISSEPCRYFGQGTFYNKNTLLVKIEVIDSVLGYIFISVHLTDDGVVDSVSFKKIEEWSFNEFKGYYTAQA